MWILLNYLADRPPGACPGAAFSCPAGSRSGPGHIPLSAPRSGLFLSMTGGFPKLEPGFTSPKGADADWPGNGYLINGFRGPVIWHGLCSYLEGQLWQRNEKAAAVRLTSVVQAIGPEPVSGITEKGNEKRWMKTFFSILPAHANAGA